MAGGGEMGALTRAKDWSQTAVGPVDTWPQSLRTTLSIILNSKFPMFLWWGPELICFYNDAYRPSLGQNGKHPHILGAPAKYAWAEIWPIIKPLIDQVLAGGEATWSEDQLIPIYRNGKIEDVYWTFSYSPVNDESGEVAGVLVTCSETTDKVNTVKNLEESNRRYLDNILKAPMAMCVFRGPDFIVEIVNERMLELWGKTEDETKGKPIFEGLPEAKGQGLEILLHQVYSTGEKFEANERSVFLPRDGRMVETFLNFVYEALREADGSISGIVAIATDVTESVRARQKIEESEERFRLVVESAPFPIGVYVGKEMLVTLANQSILDIWGKGNDVAGRPYADILPELQGSGVYEQLNEVYTTGRELHIHNQPLQLIINGEPRDFYFNYSFTPLRGADGEIYGVMNTAADVTDLNLARLKTEESEQKLRSVVENAPFPIAVYAGKEMIIELANQSMIDIWGKGNDVTGKSYIKLMAELTNQKVLDQLQEVFETGQAIHIKNQRLELIVHGMTQPFYFNYSLTPLTDASGRVYAVMNTGMDLTDLSMAKLKIEESEARFRNNVKQAPLGISIFRGPDFVVEMVNQKYLELVDRKEDDFVGRSLFESLPEVEEAVRPLLTRVFTSGQPFFASDFPVTLNRYGREDLTYFNFAYQPLRDELDIVSGIMVVATEVTESVIAKHKIQESEERFRNVANSAPVLIWMCSTDRLYYFFNTEWLKYTGRTMEQENGNGWTEGIHPDDRLKYLNVFTAAFDRKEEFYVEYRLRRHGGQYRWISDNGVPRFTTEGIFEGYIGACMDIEDQKTFATELAKQVKERTIELERKNVILENMNTELKSFAYISSHDLQEPLRKIQFYANYIEEQEQNLSEKGRAYFNRMHAAATRMRRLIDDLLSYSRINESQPAFQPVDIKTLAEEVCDEFKERILEKHATIVMPDSCMITVIPFQMKQLFSNLLSNSLKFSNPQCSPVIKISCKYKTAESLNKSVPQEKNAHYEIIFSDNGIGFEDIYKAKIFELFQRLHVKEEYEGTGIGLSIVKKVVEAHEGTITVETEVNKGTTFFISIPKLG